MTGVDKIKKVRLLKYINGLPIKEIVRRTKLARNTVRKILRSENTRFTYQRTEQARPVTNQIYNTIETWIKEDKVQPKKYRRTAWRMYGILKYEHGYAGSYESVAGCVRKAKKNLKLSQPEAYIPLVFSPGDAFQFDWGEIMVYIGNELVTLQLAVMTLCYSRRFYARAYPCQKQELMLDAHRRAFKELGGVCRRGIYDNMKTAVKKLLKGHHRNLQERFVQFCSYYLYEPEFCNPASGNEKGRVENKVGYIRRNFFVPLARFNSIEELNDRLLSYCNSVCRTEKHPEYMDKTCYELYEEERDLLIQLPIHDFECCRRQSAIVSPISIACFDNNKYSVPSEYVSSNVDVRGNADEVIISFEGKEIARHKRNYGIGRLILDPYHYLGVLSRKPGAFRDGLPFKSWKLPAEFNIYRQLLKEKYDDGDRQFAKTLVLLKDWPLIKVVAAISTAISLGAMGDAYILMLLRQSEQPEIVQEDAQIKEELARYKARQIPLSSYDSILREV